MLLNIKNDNGQKYINNRLKKLTPMKSPRESPIFEIKAVVLI